MIRMLFQMLLIIIFFCGFCGACMFGGASVYNSKGQANVFGETSFPGYSGGAIACGLIASSALVCLTYLICNNRGGK